MPYSFRSECQTRADLQISRLAATRDLTKRAIRNRAIRRTEVPIVKCVERLKTQLETHAFSELLFAIQAHVPVAIGWSTKVRFVAVAVSCRIRCGNSISGRIKPLLGILRSVMEMRIVQPVRYRADSRQVGIVRNCDHYRKSCAEGGYTAPLPVADDIADRSPTQ